MTRRPLWLTIPLLLLVGVVILWAHCNAEEPKPTPTLESQAAEITSLKAQLASAIADKEVIEVQFQLQMQVCNSPDFSIAKAKAVEARKLMEAAKPKDKPNVKPPIERSR